MKRFHRIYLFTLLIIFSSGAAIPSADAAELVDSDEFTLQAGALGEVGLSLTESEHHEADPPPATTLRLARLSLGGTWKQLAGAKLQVEGRSGDVELLDLALEATPTEWLAINAGRFKLPVSREFLIPAGDMLFSNRALILELAPRRSTGLEVAVEAEADSVGIKGAVGLFQPGRGLLENEGQLLVARTAVEPAHGLEVHIAFAEHVFDDNRYVDDAVAPAVERPVFAYDRQIDVAIGYHGEHLHLLGEGLVVLDSQLGDHPWAAHASGAYRFRAGEVGLEPALAYDALDAGGELTHRGAAAFNTYWLDTHVMTTLEYELELPEDGTSHVVSLLMQVGF
ncbi:MAG: hypothetical protein ACQEVA_02585 [Myxococcota bacterium]